MKIAQTFPVGPRGDCECAPDDEEATPTGRVCGACGAVKSILVPKRRRHGLAKDGSELESEIRRDCASALVRVPGIRVANNQNGQLFDRNGTPVRYGLGSGSADLVGIAEYRVEFGTLRVGAPAWCTVRRVDPTQSFTLGRVLCIEVKRPKTRNAKRDRHQKRWLEVMQKRGAIVGVATSVEEALAIVEVEGFDITPAQQWIAATRAKR